MRQVVNAETPGNFRGGGCATIICLQVEFAAVIEGLAEAALQEFARRVLLQGLW